jgi:hypothetical protein
VSMRVACNEYRRSPRPGPGRSRLTEHRPSGDWQARGADRLGTRSKPELPVEVFSELARNFSWELCEQIHGLGHARFGNVQG